MKQERSITWAKYCAWVQGKTVEREESLRAEGTRLFFTDGSSCRFYLDGFWGSDVTPSDLNPAVWVTDA